MGRFIATRVRIAALVLSLPGLCLSMTGCGSPQGETGTSITTSQEELDQINAEMQSNEAAAQPGAQ